MRRGEGHGDLLTLSEGSFQLFAALDDGKDVNIELRLVESRVSSVNSDWLCTEAEPHYTDPESFFPVYRQNGFFREK